MSIPIHATEWHRDPPIVSTRMGRVFVCGLSVLVDGEWRTTSPIAKVDGNTVTTRSGSVYVLDGDVAGILSEPPFYLYGGDVYPPGATAPPVPPPRPAPLAEVLAFYGDRAFVVAYPEGDHDTLDVKKPEWARGYAKARGGVLYLNGAVVE